MAKQQMRPVGEKGGDGFSDPWSVRMVRSAGACRPAGAKQSGLLAGVVPDAGQPMSTDRLVQEPWGNGGSGAGWADREARRLEALHLEAQPRHYDPPLAPSRAAEGPEVVDLEHRILDHDPTLAPADPRRRL